MDWLSNTPNCPFQGITRKTRVLGAATTRKRGVFGTGFEKREGPKNWSFSKEGSWELIYLLSLLLLVKMINQWGVFCQTEKGRGVGGLRCGHNPKKGGLRYGPNSKKGVSGAGHVKKSGSLPRHIHILDIYVSATPGNEYYNLKCDKHYLEVITLHQELTGHVLWVLDCIKCTREKYHEVWYDDHT